MFDFSASLNDVAPVSPMLFPVDLMKKVWIADGHPLCVVSFVLTSTKIKFRQRCV